MVENEALDNLAADDMPESMAAEPEASEESVDEAAEEGSEEAAGLASLTLMRGGVPTAEVFSFTPPAVIGRFDPAVGPIEIDLGTIDEGRYVSRKHAKITCDDGVWRVHDLGSSNGTYVLRSDFERVDEADLSDGDELAFGNARFVFRLPVVSAGSVPVEPSTQNSDGPPEPTTPYSG